VPAARPTRALSPAGLEFLKQWEGFRDRPGNDAEGHCTVGYGSVLHTGGCDGRPIEEPYASGITPDTAAQLLTEKCAELRQFLDDSLTTTLNQNQSDALISFVHNVGGEAFRASTLLNVLNTGDASAAAREMRKWTKAARNGGVVEVPELIKRREAEAQLFERPVAMAQSLSLPHPRLFGRAFSAVDYSVPGIVPIVTQPTPRTCWAAVITMMYSWRHGQSIAVRDALARISPTYVDMFNRDVALDSNLAPALYRDAGLSTITSFNPTIEGWDLLLRKYGPLYVDVGYNTGNMTHAIIVTGIRGDGSADGTSITYIDPINGNTVTRKFSDFLTSYEATTAVQWPYVIVHWPAGAHASAQQSFTRTHSYSFHSPSVVTAQSHYSHQQNPAALIAGIEIADAVQIGLAAVAIVQTQVAASQGTFSLSYDKAQRLLMSEARSQMPGSQSSKQRYSQLLFHLGIGRLGTAKADVIIEWEGNPYGEIGTPIIRRSLSSSTEWSKSAANITITKVDRIPVPRTDPRTWPIVYTYEGTYDPLANGYFEFSGEFELNAFGGLKFNRHEVVSRSMADWALAGTPEGKVQRGADVVVPVPEIPEEQVAYLRTRLP
jgi:GH24 family phage-related lysozyme (muramidase)